MLFNIRLLALVLILISLYSCEYKLDEEYFRDIKKPTLGTEFDLSLVGEEDTIKIFTETEFTCDFNLDGLTALEGEFSLQGRIIGAYSEFIQFKINPQEYSPGYDTLILVLYTNTGSGSLADITKVEAYKVVRKWLVLLDGRRAPILSVTSSITPEGYLKISWPKCEQYNFQYYNYYSTVNTGGIEKKITNADSNYYIDSCYFGGEATFRVDVKVATINEQSYGNVLYFNDPSYPTLNFTELGLDSLRIYWDKSRYKVTYNLICENISPHIAIFKSHTDTSFTMLSPGLGNTVSFILTTSPFNANSSNAYYNRTDFKYYSLGTFIESNWPVYGYNQMEKALYTSTYNEVHCYDIESLTLRNSLWIEDLLYQKNYACPTNSSKVAVLSPNNISIFPDRKLQNPILIPYSCRSIIIDHFFMTDNDIIAIATANKYEQIQISDKQVIASINIDDYPVSSRWACITTSKSGKYVCMVTQKGLILYSIVNNVVTAVYSDARSYSSALFDESSEGRLLLTFNETTTLEIRNPSGFSLVNSVILPTKAQIIGNIDPESGYLLLTDYKNNYVMDLTNSKLKLKVQSTEFKPKLYSNRLFTGNGSTIDISKYLSK